MRYRRSGARYALVLTHRHPQALADPWLAGHATVRLAQPRWRPRTDVYETADSFRVTVDLAGVDPDDLDVTLHEDAMVVEGSRTLPAREEQGFYHCAEIPQGPFRLEIGFQGLVDTDSVHAHYDRGLLDIVLKKRRAGA